MNSAGRSRFVGTIQGGFQGSSQHLEHGGGGWDPQSSPKINGFDPAVITVSAAAVDVSGDHMADKRLTIASTISRELRRNAAAQRCDALRLRVPIRQVQYPGLISDGEAAGGSPDAIAQS